MSDEEIEKAGAFSLRDRADTAEREAERLTREAKHLRETAGLLEVRDDMPRIVAYLRDTVKSQEEAITALRGGLSLALRVLRENGHIDDGFALEGVLEPKRR